MKNHKLSETGMIAGVIMLVSLTTAMLGGEPIPAQKQWEESKPVQVNGVDFVISTRSQWDAVCQTPVRLLVTNRSNADLVFPLYVKIEITLKDHDGKDVNPIKRYPVSGPLLGPRPVVIPAGSNYCVNLGELTWKQAAVDKDHSLFFGIAHYGRNPARDEIEWDYGPLSAGTYSLSLSWEITQEEAKRQYDDPHPLVWVGDIGWPKVEPQGKDQPNLPVWSGKAVTGTVTFDLAEIVRPTFRMSNKSDAGAGK